MTNTPKPQANTLEEILRDRVKFIEWVCRGTPSELITDIQALITAARIDELEAIRHKDEVDTNKFRPSNNPLSQSITDRLKQLKENK